MRTLVLGLGNDLAGDDAVGIVAVRRLRERLDGDVDVVESSASGMALIEILSGYERAIIVDAMRTGRQPAGTIVRMDLSEVGDVVAPSLHQAGLPELAAVADRSAIAFPSETAVLAVEVEDPFTLGAPMTPAVEAAVDGLVVRVELWVHGPTRPLA